VKLADACGVRVGQPVHALASDVTCTVESAEVRLVAAVGRWRNAERVFF